MDEMEEDTEEQKAKISRLAIVSLLLSVVGVCLLVLILYCFGIYGFIGQSKMPFYLSPLYVYGHLVSGLMVIGGIAAGIVAIKKILNKRRILKGRQVAISGLLIGVVFMVFWIWHSPNSPFTARKRCSANLRALGICMLLYASDCDEKYPTADKWCDILSEYMDIGKGITADERVFKCPANKKKHCSYAINSNVSPRSHPSLVLLFETEGGWNRFGGPELVTVENHNGEGCNILFSDMHVEFVKPEQLDELNWGAEQK